MKDQIALDLAFWTTVREDFCYPKDLARFNYICHHSTLFAAVWNNIEQRQEIRNLAKNFLETFKQFNEFKIGIGSNLFSESTGNLRRSIRIVFLDWMIRRVKY